MFRVRKWTGEEINSGTRGEKQRECSARLHWDVARVSLKREFESDWATVGVKGTYKLTTATQRRKIIPMVDASKRTFARYRYRDLTTVGVSVFCCSWVSPRLCLTVNLVPDCPTVAICCIPLVPAVCLSHGYEIHSHLPRDVSLYTLVAVQPSCWDDR